MQYESHEKKHRFGKWCAKHLGLLNNTIDDSSVAKIHSMHFIAYYKVGNDAMDLKLDFWLFIILDLMDQSKSTRILWSI